jgi:hypothetical protein
MITKPLQPGGQRPTELMIRIAEYARDLRLTAAERVREYAAREAPNVPESFIDPVCRALGDITLAEAIEAIRREQVARADDDPPPLPGMVTGMLTAQRNVPNRYAAEANANQQCTRAVEIEVRVLSEDRDGVRDGSDVVAITRIIAYALRGMNWYSDLEEGVKHTELFNRLERASGR